MSSLTIIKEELEEEVPDDYTDLVNKLINQVKHAVKRAEECEEQLKKNELNDNRIKELMNLCQSKSTEIFALERKVKDLTIITEEKDEQIISMLSMAQEFKQLVGSEDKGIQTENIINNDFEHKLLQSEEKTLKVKERIFNQAEEIQKFKPVNFESHEPQFISAIKKKSEPKIKPGGYYPLFLRKPRDGVY